LATVGLPDPEPPLPAAGPFVAIAVGKTKEGESLPAKPLMELRQLGQPQEWYRRLTQLRETGTAAD
jgi:hypothetical protein